MSFVHKSRSYKIINCTLIDVNADVFISESIRSEFESNRVKSGQYVSVLENALAEVIES